MAFGDFFARFWRALSGAAVREGRDRAREIRLLEEEELRLLEEEAARTKRAAEASALALAAAASSLLLEAVASFARRQEAGRLAQKPKPPEQPSAPSEADDDAGLPVN